MTSKSERGTAAENPLATVEGLAEVVPHVHDMAASLAFYRDLLGLTVISPPERTNPVFPRAGAATAAPPALVVLVQLPADATAFINPRTLHHLALAIPSETFGQTKTDLAAAGHAVRSGQHPIIPPNTMYLDNPDGNEVELIAPT